MTNLLDKISSDRLVLVSVIMCFVILCLAIMIVWELLKTKKTDLETGTSDNGDDGNKEKLPLKAEEKEAKLNIKEDENITYAVENEELEKTKAKMELEKLKQKLQEEEKAKEKIESKTNSLEGEKTKEEPISQKEELEQRNSSEWTKQAEFTREDKTASAVTTESKIESPKEESPSLGRSLEEILHVTPPVVLEKKEESTISTPREEVAKKEKTGTLGQSEMEKILQKAFATPSVSAKKVEDKPLIGISSEKEVLPHATENRKTPPIEVGPVRIKLKAPDDEEDAIISYEELKNATSFGYTDEEMAHYQDEKDAIISIEELEKMYQESSEIEEAKFDDFTFKKVEDLPKISDEKKFQSTPTLSPVYGKTLTQEEQKEKISLEQTANLERLNDEIKKTNEFLKALKDLKKNLE